jgi:hypothetical protein
MEVIEHTETGSHKTVMKPFKSFERDYIRQTEFLQEAQQQILVNQERAANGNLYTCDNREGGDKDSSAYFIPIFVADLQKSGDSTTFTEGTCFGKLVFSYTVEANSDVTLTIDASRPKGVFCRDWFFIGNTDLQQVESITETGTHTITFTNLNSDE